LPLADIDVKIGDSKLPPTFGSGGSWGAGNFTNAVYEACTILEKQLAERVGGTFKKPPTVAELMAIGRIDEIAAEGKAVPSPEMQKYSIYTFAANFAEVRVDAELGRVRVTRFLTATAAGRILNPKTARSQLIGGIVWGLGQALTEESVLDKRYGNFITRSFADYHVPANLDIGEIETIFVEEDDKIVNKLGVKGIGEIGITSVAAAIANAIFNATGKRVRSLPITPDKLL